MVILLLGVVLGGRKSLWGAFVGAAIVVLLPNLLSNRLLFQIFSGTGFVLRLNCRNPRTPSQKHQAFSGSGACCSNGAAGIWRNVCR